jgi:D-serine deaminase-like pyridoxal phosphate-dependent protein
MTGAADILLAYQPVGPKLLRFISLILRYSSTTFSCLIDNLASAKSIADASLAEHLTVPVFVDVNVGMNRTGISPFEAATFYETCTSLPGIKLQGLHFYDGQIRTKNFEQRTKECDETFIAIDDIIKNLAKKGFKEVIVIAGGSPTFPIHLKRKNVECSPGTFIFWDKSYEALCAEQPFITAALVITRVVSLPDATTLCLDLGHKSIASENELDKRVYFLNAPDLKVKGHSEEHMVVEAREGHPYKPGDVLYGLPFHICPTVALYERGLVIENKAVSTEWKIVARDRKLTV